MNYWALTLAAIPVLFAVLRKTSGKYVFSALVTLSCLAIVSAVRGAGWGWLACGFVFSVAGDYLLAHQQNRPNRFIEGVGGFFLAHACFLAYALKFSQINWISYAAFAVLSAGYAVYLVKDIFPASKGAPLKVALSVYVAISVCVFSVALSMRIPVFWHVLFVLGIASIMFSDTLISLSRFLGRKRLKKWILPTYYLCHILLTIAHIGNGV